MLGFFPVKELKFFSTPEGYAEPNSKSFDYIYQYKDHLGNVRLSYKNPNDSFQNIIDSDLTNSYDGWFHAGTVTSELIDGSLKVDVDAAWEGVQHQLNNMSVAPGDKLHVKLVFDKGNTQSNVRLYFQELDANGNHLSWNTLNGNLQTGTYSYPYTVNAASKLVLRIDKDNTNTGNLTSFYIDYVSVTTGELEIIEENNYYPFGLKHKGYNTNITSTNIALKRKFGVKEYQDELGLDWYDITARNYDPALGRWMNIDPLAEQMRRHSPYNYAFNNPIFFIDPDGLAPIDYVDGDGNLIGTDGTTDEGTLMITNKEDIEQIKTAEKNGQHIGVGDLKEFNLSMVVPNDNELKESLNVLNRMKENGGLREEASTVGFNGLTIESATGEFPSITSQGLAEANVTIHSNDFLQGGGFTSIHGHPTTILETNSGDFAWDALTPTPGVDDIAFKNSHTNIIVGKIDNKTNLNVFRDQKTSKIIDNRREGIAVYRFSAKPAMILTTKTVTNIINRHK